MNAADVLSALATRDIVIVALVAAVAIVAIVFNYRRPRP